MEEGLDGRCWAMTDLKCTDHRADHAGHALDTLEGQALLSIDYPAR